MFSKGAKILFGISGIFIVGIVLAITLPLTLNGDSKDPVPPEPPGGDEPPIPPTPAPTPDPDPPTPAPTPDPDPPVEEMTAYFSDDTKELFENTCFLRAGIPNDQEFDIFIDVEHGDGRSIILQCLSDDNVDNINTFKAPYEDPITVPALMLSNCEQLRIAIYDEESDDDNNDEYFDIIDVKRAFFKISSTGDGKYLGEYLVPDYDEDDECKFVFVKDTVQLLDNIEENSVTLEITQLVSDQDENHEPVIYLVSVDIVPVESIVLEKTTFKYPSDDPHTLILEEFSITPSSQLEDWAIPLILTHEDDSLDQLNAELHHKFFDDASEYSIVLLNEEFKAGSYQTNLENIDLDFSFSIEMGTLDFSELTLTRFQTGCFNPEMSQVISAAVEFFNGVTPKDISIRCGNSELVLDVLEAPDFSPVEVQSIHQCEYLALEIYDYKMKSEPVHVTFTSLSIEQPLEYGDELEKSHITISECDYNTIIDISELALYEVMIDDDGMEQEYKVNFPYQLVDDNTDTLRIKLELTPDNGGDDDGDDDGDGGGDDDGDDDDDIDNVIILATLDITIPPTGGF